MCARYVQAVLKRIGLHHAANRTVRKYSKGMCQRLGLGIAILAEPELLILDEPTGGLDQEGLTLLWSIFEEWRQAKRLVLVTSHNLTLLEHRIDRVSLLNDGVIGAEGSPTELRVQAALPITIDLSFRANEPQFQLFLERIRDWDRLLSLQLMENRLVLKIPPDALLSLLSHRKFDQRLFSHVRVNEPGLDDVYHSLLRKVS